MKFEGQQPMGCQVIDPKFRRGHLLVMNNNHTKFEVPKPNRSLVIDWKQFFSYKVNVTLTFDPKYYRGHLLVMKPFLSETVFTYKYNVTVTFDP
jgi:hypothetical protein